MVPDAVIGESHMIERKERLEKWLQCVLSIPVNRDYHETSEFLEVSRYSFVSLKGFGLIYCKFRSMNWAENTKKEN